VRLLDLLEEVAPNLTLVLRRDAWWMTWNLLLAWIPVGLAVLLFWNRGPGRRSLGWWTGLALFVLFLPNAPYVMTDLVHLRHDVFAVKGDLAVVTVVVPVYGTFIAAGMLAYYLALRLLGDHLDRIGLGRWRASAFVAIHAVCAVGVFLGRVTRLNSWEPVVQPHDVLQRAVVGLTWQWAPFFVTATFVVTWAAHFATRAVAEAAWQTAVRLVRTLRSYDTPAPGPA
jgi:uncharacterized membrane protein